MALGEYVNVLLSSTSFLGVRDLVGGQRCIYIYRCSNLYGQEPPPPTTHNPPPPPTHACQPLSIMQHIVGSWSWVGRTNQHSQDPPSLLFSHFPTSLKQIKIFTLSQGPHRIVFEHLFVQG